MALTTSRVSIRGDFEPLPGSVYHAAYPDCYRAAGGPHPRSACTCDWEAQLELLFAQVVKPEKVAAFLIEPVIGEGGYIVPPDDFLPRLRQIATRNDILLICDEVQTGFGRTGRFWAQEHWNVTGDITVTAKGIASGLPLSGIIARARDARRLGTRRARRHVRRQRRRLRSRKCHARRHRRRGAGRQGAGPRAQLLDGLERLAPGRRSIGNVRGLGLMVALEFVKPGVGDGRDAGPGRWPSGSSPRRFVAS